MSAATWSTRGPIAVITLDNPPVNGLGYELRKGILEGLDRAEADPAVKAVVLIGAGRGRRAARRRTRAARPGSGRSPARRPARRAGR